MRKSATGRMKLRTSMFLVLMAISGIALASGVATYMEKIRQSESAGNYGATTDRGTATGAYQFTAGSLKNLGLVSYTSTPSYGAGEWDNVTWNENAWGVSSRQDFLNNTAAQDAVMVAYTQNNWNGLNASTKSYIGQSVNGMIVDESALLAGAHFLGAGGMNQFASCGFQSHCLDQAWADANGMTKEELAAAVRQRMMDYAGLDVAELADGSYTPGGGVIAEGTHLLEDPAPYGSMASRAARIPELPPLQGRLPTI